MREKINQELRNAKPIRKSTVISGTLFCLLLMFGSYAIDGLPVISFGIVPAVCLVTYSILNGFNFKTTPRLFSLVVFIAFSFCLASVIFVSSSPK